MGSPILYPGMFQGGDRVSKTQCGAFNSYPGCQFNGVVSVTAASFFVKELEHGSTPARRPNFNTQPAA